MTNDQLHNNRKCQFGGGREDCPCNGDCPFMKIGRCECGHLSEVCYHPDCTTGIINAARGR